MSNILKVSRKAKGLTQAAVADAIGCDQATVSKYEAGTTSPTKEIAPALAALLGLPIVQVLYPDRPDIWNEKKGLGGRKAA